MKKSLIVLFLTGILSSCGFYYAERYPLNSAASSGNVSKVETLVNSGVSINKRDKSGLTPLMLAIYYNKWETTKELVEMGADVNAKDLNDTTPLLYAIYGGQPKTVTLLADHGANFGERTSDGQTPLMVAIIYNRPDIARIIADRGANINAQDIMEMTPLLYAVDSCHPDTVGFLIKHGAKVNVKDNQGKTAIHHLVENCSGLPKKASAIINSLLENGCDIAAVDKAGHSAFREAMEYRLTDMVALLRKNGVVERFNRFEEGANHFDESLRSPSFFIPAPGAYIIPQGKKKLYQFAVEDCNHLVVNYKQSTLYAIGPLGYVADVLVDKHKIPAKHQACMEEMGFQRDPAMPLER